MSLSYRTRQVIGSITMWSFFFQNTLVFALPTDIQKHDQFKTDTNIQQQGNTYNISTGTNVSDMGINAFKKFDVGSADIVNLNLTDTQNKLLNLIYDKSASQIDGVINSYKNGQIGGNVLFANSNGFVIGKDGAFNVGSLTLMTPSSDTMKGFFDSHGKVLKQPITDLISFEIDDKHMLKLKDNIEIEKNATIDIKGKINAQHGVDIIAGKAVNVSGEIKANIADLIVNTASETFTTAIVGGNGIMIVTKSHMKDAENNGSKINITGNVTAKGAKNTSDIVISAQSHTAHSDAEVRVENGAKITGRDVSISAIQDVEGFQDSAANNEDAARENAFVGAEFAEYFIGNIADLSAKVIVENGAEISATNNLGITSAIHTNLSSSMMMAVLAINYTEINSLSEAIISKGAKIYAKNLDLQAKTDISLDFSSKSSSLSFLTDKNKLGDLAVGILLQDIATKATIEKGAELNISGDISISADTQNDVSMLVKNGVIPVIDKNTEGAFSGALAVAIIDVTTKAIMDADVKTKGELKVSATARGRSEVKTSASAGGEGESGAAAKYGKTWIKNILFGDGIGTNKFTQKLYGSLNKLNTRSNAKFNNFDLSAAVTVAIADYVTEATIGSKTIAPKIEANNVEIYAKTVDDKSNVVALSEAKDAKTAIAGAVAIHLKDLSTNASAFGEFYINNIVTNPNALTRRDALKIVAENEILHPLSYYDFFKNLSASLNKGNLFSKETLSSIGEFFTDDLLDKEAWSKAFFDLDGNFKMPDTSGITNKLNAPDLDFLLKGILNTSNFGLENLFNTYAQAASAAKQKEGSTTGFSGAITASLMDSTANAFLGKEAKITLLGENKDMNKVNIISNIHNQIWTMSGLFAPLDIKNLMAGASARDGSAYGAGIVFNYADNNNSAYLDEGAQIVQTSSQMGDITLDAKTTGQYVSTTFGSANADETGMSGAIGLTLTGGETSAYTGKGTKVQAGNLTVSALNDTNYIHSINGISNSDTSIAVGISGIAMFDNVKAYLDGNIFAEGNISLKAKSDRLIVNLTNNLSLAKEGASAPQGSKQNDSQSELGEDGAFNLAGTFLAFAFSEDRLPTNWEKVKLELKGIEDTEKFHNDWERSVDSDKETKAYAGSVGANVITSNVDAYIADGATIKTLKDLTISAVADVLSLNEAAVVSAKGKTGGGGSVLADVYTSNVTAKIGKNAIVDVDNKLLVDALQDYLTIQAGIGVAQAKNSSGAGTVGSLVQVNTTEAYIDEGAQINQNNADTASSEQSVILSAENDTLLIKGLGALAIQSGADSGATGSKAKGGTVDGNVIVNKAEATIRGTSENIAKVKAKKTIKVGALNDNLFVNADMAGSVSTGGSGYAGLISSNTLINETIAGLEYTTLEGSADVLIDGTDKFREIIVAGVVAVGKEKGMGATFRTSVLNNSVDTYIKNSILNTNSLSQKNNSLVNQISIIASGAGSSDGTAAVGSVGALISLSEQKNYIDNSTITVANDLSLENKSENNVIAITGAVAMSSGGNSAGGSLFASVIKNDMETYLKNTTTHTKNTKVSSNAKDNIKTITVGGALSSGKSAYAGALSDITNIGTTQAYILGGNHSAEEKIRVEAHKNIDTLQINGQASVSTSGSAVGGAVATTINKNETTAYISGATLSAKKGISVIAKAINDFLSIPVGVSAGKGIAAQGSIDTYVLANNVNAYILDSKLKTSGEIEILADQILDLISTAGGASVSLGGSAVGAGMFTGVFSGDTNAFAENVTLESDDAIESFKIAANSEEDLNIVTVSGAAGTGALTATGVVQTIVIDKDTNATAKNIKAKDTTFKKLTLAANTATDLDQVAGQAAVSGSGMGAGGSVETLVVNKKVNSLLSDIATDELNLKDNLDLSASSNFENTSTTVGVSVGSTAAIQGAVSTKVLDIETSSKIDNAKISGTSKQKIANTNQFDIVNTLATLSASGTAAGGGVVGSLVNNSKSYVAVENSSIQGNALEISNSIKDDYVLTLANAAIGGTAGVAGAVSTVVLNTDADTQIEKSSIEETNDIVANTKNETSLISTLGQVAGGGTGAVGASVATLVSNKNTQTNIKDSSLSAKEGKIELLAQSIDDIFTGVAGGAGAGTGAVVGSLNSTIFDNETSVIVENSALKAKKDSKLLAEETLTLGGYSGAAVGGGVAAVGATLFTSVINNSILTNLKNSSFDVTSGSLNLEAQNYERLGYRKNGTEFVASPIMNVAGSGAGVANVNGLVNTLTSTSQTKTTLEGRKDGKSIETSKDLNILAQSETDIITALGSVGGAGFASIGASIGNVVLNKDTSALIKDTSIKTLSGTTDISAKNKDKLIVSAVAGSGSAGAALNGATTTNVLENNVSAKVLGSVLETKDLKTSASQISDINASAGSVSGGTVGIGASVLTNVLGNDVVALVDSTVQATNDVSVDAKSEDIFINNTISGSAGGVAIGGAVNTNVVGNAVSAGLKGNINARNAKVSANSLSNFKEQATGSIAAGAVGVGASSQTNAISNQVEAFAGGNISANNLTIEATAKELMKNIYAIGFAAGIKSAAGTSLVNKINTSVLAYSEENANFSIAEKLLLNADSKTEINSISGSAAVGAKAGGASVMVNEIDKKVGAFTGKSTVIEQAQEVKLSATSTNLIGEDGKSLKTIAGAIGKTASVTGSVLVNNINDTVLAGLGESTNLKNITALDIDAQSKNMLYLDTGAAAIGVTGAAVGAMVNVNNINNTTNAFVGKKATVNASGKVAIDATSNNTVQSNGMIISGGAVALSGGVVVTNVGQNIASIEDTSTKLNVDSANMQAQEMLGEANTQIADAQSEILASKKETKASAQEKIDLANRNIKSFLQEGLKANLSQDALPTDLAQYNQAPQVQLNIPLPSTSEHKAPVLEALRTNSTAVMIDAEAQVSSNEIELNAKDETNITLKTAGGTLGLLSAGVSGAVANSNATTEVVVGANSKLNAENNITLKAESKDILKVDSYAVAAGAVSGSGNFAVASSNKNTRVQALNYASILSGQGKVSLLANTDANVQAKSWGGSFGGLSVGASIARANANGQTSILTGLGNFIKASKTIDLSARSKMETISTAEALSGALVGVTGADARTSTGQNTAIELGADFQAETAEDLKLTADVNNKSSTNANSRNYGVVAGGTSVAVAEAVGGTKIKLADGTQDNKNNISVRDFIAKSTLENDLITKTYAGTGGLAVDVASRAESIIDTNNSIYLGKTYDIIATGNFDISGETKNTYRSYIDSSAYGVIASGGGLIENEINSKLKIETYLDSIKAEKDISFLATNSTKKADNGYDLEGGSGGIVGLGSAKLQTGISHDTTVTFGGKKATSKGKISVAAKNIIDVTEKVKVDAYGGIPSAAGYVYINRGNDEEIKATLNIENNEILAKDDITYGANADVSLLSKSDVVTKGVAPVADGESFSTGKISNTVNLKNGSFTDGRRDVWVEAASKLKITSQMYSDSSGLIWDFGDADTQAKAVIANKINSENASILSAYDKLTVNTKDTTSLTGTKSAKTKFFLVVGIPITSYNYDNTNNIEKTSHSSKNDIVLNGEFRSGEGANKSLTIDKSGKATGDIEYSDKTLDIRLDKQIEEGAKKLSGSYENEKKAIKEEINLINNDNEAIKTAIENNWTKIGDQKKIYTDANSDKNKYNELNETTQDKWTAEQKELAIKTIKSSNLPDKLLIEENIQKGIILTETELGSVKKTIGEQITEKENEMKNARSEIKVARSSNISNYKKKKANDDSLSEKNNELTILDEKYKNDLLAIKEGINSEGNFSISVIDIKDTIVRSGETILNGNVSGSGKISAPGNAFSITVNNNTTNSISYNKLIINDDVRGKVYINGKDIMGANTSQNHNGVSLNLKNSAKNSLISINNNIDRNDPSFSFDHISDAGEIVFNGLVQNNYGNVEIKNLSGNILSESSIYAKNISMLVPNGDMHQGFSDNVVHISGEKGNEKGFYAGGDITIMAKTINVNGVIQSGTVDKKVLIKSFTINDDCNSNSCKQLINGEWVTLEKSPNANKDTWYQLSGDASTGIDMSNPDNPNLIKAYYDFATGEIILYRANIEGGDITLVGNVISTGNGEIRLMSGYGQIDVQNNSGKNLVLSELNADKKLDGKLYVYDIKKAAAEANDGGLIKDLEDKYKTADKNNIKTSDFWTTLLGNSYQHSVSKTDGVLAISDGSKGNTNASTIKPNNGNAYFTPENGSKLVTYKKGDYEQIVYVPKSWLYELFYGKTFVTEKISTNEEVTTDAKNDVKINFFGYDKASINISSNADVLLKENVSALSGDVSISGKNIFVDAINNQSQISAKNILLQTDGDVGKKTSLTTENSIKVNLQENGKLTVRGKEKDKVQNAYVAWVNGDANNFDISAENLAYLNVANGDFVATDANQILKANEVEIMAMKGSISANDNIKAKEKISAWAKDDINIASTEDIHALYVRSDEGDVNLKSDKNIFGIIANPNEYSANIIAQNVSLEAGKDIGENEDGKELNISAQGHVTAKAENVNLRSVRNLFINKIEAKNDVRLISNASILSAGDKTSQDIIAHNLLAVAINGNIENLDVDLDGTLQAYAGYRNLDGKWSLTNASSSININQTSQMLTEEQAKKLTLADIEKFKDFKLLNVQAAKIFLETERNMQNASNSSAISGEKAVLVAENGSIGALSKFMTVGLSGSLSAYAKENVFIDSGSQNLIIGEIMGLQDKESSTQPLGLDGLNVVYLKSGKNILDGNSEKYVDEEGKETYNEKYNIVAKDITLEAQEDIGTAANDFNVFTTDSTQGLSIKAKNAFLSSLDNLTIKKIDVQGNSFIEARRMDGESEVRKDILIKDISSGGNLRLIAENAKVEKSKISGSIQAYITDTFELYSSENINLEKIETTQRGFTKNVILKTSQSLLNVAELGEDTIKAENLVIEANTIGANDNFLKIRTSETGSNLDIQAAEDAYIEVVGNNAFFKNLKGKEISSTINGNAKFANISAENINLFVLGNLEIEKISAKKAWLKNQTSKSSILAATISDYAEIKTLDKFVVIDNNRLSPRLDANAQIYAPNKTISVVLDETKDIKTDHKNITRHSAENSISGSHEDRSMASQTAHSSQTQILNNKQPSSGEQTGEIAHSIKWNNHQIDGSTYKKNNQELIGKSNNLLNVDELSFQEDNGTSNSDKRADTQSEKKYSAMR